MGEQPLRHCIFGPGSVQKSKVRWEELRDLFKRRWNHPGALMIRDRTWYENDETIPIDYIVTTH